MCVQSLPLNNCPSSISIRSPSINAFRLPTILNFYHSNQIWRLKFSSSKHFQTKQWLIVQRISLALKLYSKIISVTSGSVFLVTKNCPSSISIQSPSINDFRLQKISTIFIIQIKFAASNIVAPFIHKSAEKNNNKNPHFTCHIKHSTCPKKNWSHLMQKKSIFQVKKDLWP